jgi:hypothetical protein
MESADRLWGGQDPTVWNEEVKLGSAKIAKKQQRQGSPIFGY